MADKSAFDDDDVFAALTLTDYIEIVGDALEEAVDKLNEREIEELCNAIRSKIDRIKDEHLEQRPAPEPEQARDRWWDR